MAAMFTAAELQTLPDVKLFELAERLDKLCWTMSSFQYQRRGSATEEALDLVEAELQRRGYDND